MVLWTSIFGKLFFTKKELNASDAGYLFPLSNKPNTIMSKPIFKPIKHKSKITLNTIENKSGKVINPENREEKISVGYCTNDWSPICYYDNHFNEEQALRSRVILDTPKGDFLFQQNFKTDVLKNHRLLIPNMDNIKTDELQSDPNLCFKASKKYPGLHLNSAIYLYRSNARPSVKRTLYKTFLKLQSEGITEKTHLTKTQQQKWTLRSAFLKMENLLYRTPAGTKNKAPRFISGAQAEFICLVGPWMMACQDRLKLSWNLDHFITFTSGKSNEEMGECISDSKYGQHFFEDDIGTFDSSVNKIMLQLEYELFKRWKAPTAVLELVKANMKTRGRTKFGFRYKVEATRKSGDPYTSLGNSLLNGLMHYYIYKYKVYGKHLRPYGRLVKIVVGSSVREAYVKNKLSAKQRNVHRYYTKQTMSKLKMLVQGDDNAGRSDVVIDWVPDMKKFGFSSEAINHNSLYNVNFCSSRFYPTADGVVMGPLPGKVLAKFGYYVEKPEKVTNKQLLRGSALGLYKQCYFIEPIKILLDKIIKDTEGEKAYFTKNYDWQLKTTKYHEPTASTSALLQEKYNWKSEYAEHFKKALPHVDSPKHLKLPYLETMYDLDTSGPKVYF